MEKRANPSKVMALLKSGRTPEQAVRAAYPDWDDRKVRRAAAMLKSAMSAGAVKHAAARAPEHRGKATFSPAMDDSPALKGRQSKLPDFVQAAILKKKGKKKTASLMAIGLREASAVLYDEHYSRMELEKVAFFGTALGKGVGWSALKGAALGGGATALGRGAKMWKVQKAAQSGVIDDATQKMLDRKAQLDGGAARTAGDDEVEDMFKFYNEMKAIKPGDVKGNWQSYAKSYLPRLADSAMQGAAIGGVGGAGLKAGMNHFGRSRVLDTLKGAAVPAGVGLGAGLVLSS